MQDLAQKLVDSIVEFATDLLIPAMIVSFGVAVVLRILIYYTISRENWFATEFEKRVHRFFDETDHREHYASFFVMAKRLLEKTYYELFEVRAIMKRRKIDFVGAMSDRVFLIQHGAAFLVKDTLKQLKFLKYGGDHPKLHELSKNVFQNNPCFNRVFGIIPTSRFNDVLNILPSVFIIGGIFGTFLGIMKALPELGGMDLNDIEGTKMVMDDFLLKVSFSMSTSIIGIILSVLMTVLNTLLSSERTFVRIIERFENSLDLLWNRCSNNTLPEEINDFDEHRDPIEALAEQAITNEVAKAPKQAS
jgi:hypothetical protein